MAVSRPPFTVAKFKRLRRGRLREASLDLVDGLARLNRIFWFDRKLERKALHVRHHEHAKKAVNGKSKGTCFRQPCLRHGPPMSAHGKTSTHMSMHPVHTGFGRAIPFVDVREVRLFRCCNIEITSPARMRDRANPSPGGQREIAAAPQSAAATITFIGTGVTD